MEVYVLGMPLYLADREQMEIRYKSNQNKTV